MSSIENLIGLYLLCRMDLRVSYKEVKEDKRLKKRIKSMDRVKDSMAMDDPTDHITKVSRI